MDIDFLADQYEEITGLSPDVAISKSEGMKASAGIPFLKSVLHSQVTKQYKVSNRAMLKAIESKIDFPNQPKDHFMELGFKPTNVWVMGNLSIGQWGNEDNSEKALNKFFEIKSGKITYSLLPRQEYFVSNIEALEIISPALQRYINIPVRALGKALYSLPDITTIVFTPYVIIATETANE